MADYQVGGVKIHSIEPDGRLRPGKAFAPLTVDGLKTDETGNVWMASRDDIEVYPVNGEPLGKIPTPERPTNCGFSGGALYMSTPSNVYQIQTGYSARECFDRFQPNRVKLRGTQLTLQPISQSSALHRVSSAIHGAGRNIFRLSAGICKSGHFTGFCENRHFG